MTLQRTPDRSSEGGEGSRAGNSTAKRGSAMDCALRILGSRDHSVEELRSKLLTREYPASEVQESIGKLLDYGYLDDLRFAELVYRSNSSLGRKGLAAQMSKRGLDPEIWRPLLERIDGEEEYERALSVGRKHTTPAKIHSEAKDKWQRRLLGFLARRGFSSSTAYRVCHTLEQAALEDLGR